MFGIPLLCWILRRDVRDAINISFLTELQNRSGSIAVSHLWFFPLV